MYYSIVPIDRLKPLELVYPSHLKNLEQMIDSDGFVLNAIIADKKSGTIMDGSHRYVYFLMKGYLEVPVHFSDYDNEDVRVGTHLGHRYFIEDDKGISKKECRERGLSGNLYPPRTTRHFFTFRKNDISVPLDQLAKGNPVNVDHLIADVDIHEEINHNEAYIQEIDEEIKHMIKYLSEISKTREYLSTQVKFMQDARQIAFFPGKFHPPHLGHLKTLIDISSKYSKLIIGVSEDTPDNAVTNADNIVSILKSLFEHNKSIEVVKIRGVLVDKPNTEGLPKFDILLSGNPDVLTWAEGLGLSNQLVARSDGDLFSGTEIREALTEK